MEFVDTIIRVIEAQGANTLPVFTHSLKEIDEDTRGSVSLPAALTYFIDEQGHTTVDVIITAMSFALGNGDPREAHSSMWETPSLAALNVPALQAITVSSSRGQWERSERGLAPLDTAMNIALPEFDGRIITVPISFLDGPPEQNYLRRHVQTDITRYAKAGHDEPACHEYAHYRPFGSKPGAYGAGILPLIDERN